MSAYPPTVADHHKPRRLRESDALDVAKELLSWARQQNCALCLWLLPDGDYRITAAAGMAFDGLYAHNRASLIGTYKGDAMACDVVEDVWVRAEQIELEWER